MDSVVTFPLPEPSLKLARPAAEKWAATLAEERLRLQEDQDVLREREENLREYESRLRSLQAEIETDRNFAANQSSLIARPTPPPFQRPSSRMTVTDEPALQSGWEKLHRAREIFEAEHKNLRDDRISMRELELSMKRREQDVAEREARLAAREALVAAATLAGDSYQPGHTVSAVTRITRAPFDMARSVFGGKKAG